ncbi:MAG TPA: AMP-binding protein, partial [Acidimicrobiales bacterium]|nr:AMP-binding protein [Acidimicrobiales bacterium]
MFETVSEIIKDRIDDPSTAIVFEDRSWSYVEYVRECVRRASLINALRSAQSPVSDPPAQFNIGILADNIPEFPMWLGAAALSRATLVGINPTRRGKELARDITHTNCAMIVTESSCLSLLDGLDLVIDRSLILDVDSTHYCDLLASHNEASLADVDSGATKSDLLLLIFTSGTSASPKAVICSQGRLALIGSIVAQMFSLTSEDVCYGAMPMFHSNALMANWCPTVAAGATLAMRRKFSASGFIQDVRAFQATYFNYVGKTLSYILATPQSPDDSENTLRRGFGNEGTRSDVEEFSKRFGCQVTDAYGSTEGGAVVSASPDTPHGALGPAPEGTVVLDPATGQECPLAQFDDQGRLINADKAIGELVNKFGSASFEGYWDNQDATA